MKEHEKKALENGQAIDCYAEPERLREHIIKNWGYLEKVNGFNEIVEQIINTLRREGVSFWADINLYLLKIFLPMIPKYIEKELSELLKK